jgi:hypothetical protein
MNQRLEYVKNNNFVKGKFYVQPHDKAVKLMFTGNTKVGTVVGAKVEYFEFVEVVNKGDEMRMTHGGKPFWSSGTNLCKMP